MPESERGWLIDESEIDGWILRDDDQLTVFNKPALVVCHPSKQGPCSSLAGAYRHFKGVDKVHLVSRLDRETSGLVLFAKQRLAARRFQMAFQRREVSKLYLAILEGSLAETILVDADLGPDKKSVIHSKSAVRTEGKRQSAQTLFRPLHRSERYTLAQAEPLTGRKHQIRVHAQHIGHAIVGDKIYGPDEFLFLDFIESGWTEKLASKLPLNRHALHAHRMIFRFADGEQQTFLAPPTPDLVRFCQERMELSPSQLHALLEAL